MMKNNGAKGKRILSLIGLCIAIFLVLQSTMSKDTAEQLTKPSVQSQIDSKTPLASKTAIDGLTRQQTVVDYLVAHRSLPDYYIKKQDARSRGWDARSGNLCDVLPGRAIGGDRFSNREGQLPNKPGRVWYEADINYRCGHRGADRIVYSGDGLIYVTTDHYKTFRRLRGNHE
jgi:hypothetical protein